MSNYNWAPTPRRWSDRIAIAVAWLLVGALVGAAIVQWGGEGMARVVMP